MTPRPMVLIELDFKEEVAMGPPAEFKTLWKGFSEWVRLEREYCGFHWGYDPDRPYTVHVVIGKPLGHRRSLASRTDVSQAGGISPF
jgi:hypothetical protein